MPAGGTALRSIATFSCFAFRANVIGKQLDSGCSGGDHHGGTGQRFAQRFIATCAVRFALGVGNDFAQFVAHLSSPGQLARSNADFRTVAGKQPHDSPPDRSGRGQHGHGNAAQGTLALPSPKGRGFYVLASTEYGGRGGCVGAVGIEQHGDAHRTEKAVAYLGEQLLAGGDVRTANENGGVLQLGRTARKHRAVDQIANGVGFHAAVAQ